MVPPANECSSCLPSLETPLRQPRRRSMEYIRHIAAESLRMYPQPPLLIRRALEDDELPAGAGGPDGLRARITRGCDIFLVLYSIHRSPELWENPDTFDPDRFARPFKNEGIEGWAGYNPDLAKGLLYPNEVASDFAFLPFGGESGLWSTCS